MFTQIKGLIDERVTHLQCLSGNQIKIIAVICMFIDHLGAVVISSIFSYIGNNGLLMWEEISLFSDKTNYILYSIGAVAFPLFCFMLVEGYTHTNNKKKYICRLALFALISEIPFDITFFNQFAKSNNTYPFYWGYQNVLITYLLGICTLELINYLQKLETKILRLFLQCGSILAIVLLAEEVIHCDYEGYGVFLVVLFYILRKSRILQVCGVFLLATMRYTQYPVSLMVALLLILLYNGKRGTHHYKYFFYVFYPSHMVILHILDVIITCV